MQRPGRRRLRQAVAQQRGGFVDAPAGGQQRSQTQPTRLQCGFAIEGTPIVTFGPRQIPLGLSDRRQIQLRRRHVRHRLLCRQQFRHRRLARLDPGRIEATVRQIDQSPRSGDSHTPQGIGEQGRQPGQTFLGRASGERDRSGDAHDRVRVGQGGGRRRPRALPCPDIQRARAHDGGQVGVVDQGCERGHRAGFAASRGRQHFAEMRWPFAFTMVACDRRRRPGRRAIRVAGGAGIGCADAFAQVRPWNPDGMVPPRVHHHVVAARHVAVDAPAARRIRRMKVMLGRIVGLRLQAGKAGAVRRRVVASHAKRVAGGAKSAPVRFVAVGAGDARLVHAALSIGAVFEHLRQLLAVGMVVARLQIVRNEFVEQRVAGCALFDQAGAPGMAHGTLVNLGGAAGRGRVQRAIGCGQRLRCRRVADGAGSEGAGTVHMGTSAAVAGLAADSRFAPGRAVAVAVVVIALAIGRSVALAAHQVPVLVAAAPVQGVAGRDRAFGVQAEPAATFGIPGHRERLQASTRQGQQQLLERTHAECVFGREFRPCAAGIAGDDGEAIAAAYETGLFARPGVAGVVEIAEDRGGIGRRHCLGMLGVCPSHGLPFVADQALVVGDIVRSRRGLGRRGAGRRADGGGHDRGEGDGQMHASHLAVRGSSSASTFRSS